MTDSNHAKANEALPAPAVDPQTAYGTLPPHLQVAADALSGREFSLLSEPELELFIELTRVGVKHGVFAYVQAVNGTPDLQTQLADQSLQNQYEILRRVRSKVRIGPAGDGYCAAGTIARPTPKCCNSGERNTEASLVAHPRSTADERDNEGR